MSNQGEDKNKTVTWWVYVARCADGTLYAGITTAIERRERQHNGALVGGAKYTASRRPISIIACSQQKDRSAALREEIRIKRLTRKEKEAWVLGNKRNF